MKAKDDPCELAKYLALKKCEDVARHYDDAIVIGADTIVVLGNKIIGKPKDKEDARKILKNLSGQEHKVITGLAIIDTKNSKTITDFGRGRVKFKQLDDKEIDDYIATGEPMDKAGAYGLQGRGAALIEGVYGDIYAVIGLPLNKVYCVLKEIN